MRKTAVVLFLFSLVTIKGFAGEFTSFSQAKAAALEQNKPLLIDFMTTW